jgi:hypothetical protein
MSNLNCGEPCGPCATTPATMPVAAAGAAGPGAGAAGAAPWPPIPPTYAKITIVLTRQDTTKQNDVLTIEVDNYSDGFYVSNLQGVHGARTRSHYMLNTLTKYLDMYFNALSYADENYKSATFNIPHFPTVTMDVHDAKKYLNNVVLAQINFLIPDWPLA